MKINPFIFLFSTLLFGSCSVFEKTSKRELSDGFYVEKSKNKESRKVYVNIEEDIIHLHSTIKQEGNFAIDTLSPVVLFEPIVKSSELIDFSLTKKSFDLDFLTIPFKLRFPEKNIPLQLNSTLNGGVYIGYRTDIYKINYRKNPLKKIKRNSNHIGYSVGLFTGLGSTSMSASTTNDILQIDYDGVIWSNGIAGIISVNNFTVGLSIGIDNLLDKNKDVWLYQNKPWVGLAFGLNLN